MRKHYNPERRAWRGRSYKRHGERVATLKERDMQATEDKTAPVALPTHPFASPRDRTFTPGPNKVFVFGSNTRGVHGGGAAKTAYEEYGCQWGNGEGLMEPETDDDVPSPCLTYAIPTKDWNLDVREPWEIELAIRRFLVFANEHPELEFFVTRVGCGFAGFDDKDIAPMFQGAPKNCILPVGWEDPGSL